MENKKVSGTVMLESLMAKLDKMDSSTKAIIDKVEARLTNLSKEERDLTLSREATMEERLLKSVNDQVGTIMSAIQATTIKDLTDKMTMIENRIEFQKMDRNTPLITSDLQKDQEGMKLEAIKC
jgi:hypothetical protein